MDPILEGMLKYEAGCPKHVQHFLKVHAFAMLIAGEEKLSPDVREIVSAAAYMHDIGIKKSLEVYGDSNGKHQEELGPDVARTMLREMGYPAAFQARVCDIIARHHTYTGVDTIEHRIIIEADFLVNLYEENQSREAILAAREKCFETETGRRLLNTIFLGETA